MNLFALLKEFLNENYDKKFEIRKNQMGDKWFEVCSYPNRRITIQLFSDATVKIWSFDHDHAVMGSLAGHLYSTDPDFLQKISDVILRKLGLKPCQRSKTTT